MLLQNRDLVCSYLINGEVHPINRLPLEMFCYILKMAETRTNLEQFVDKHIDQSWNWGKYGLSMNPSITPEFVKRHLDKPWHFGKHGLSSNSSIALEFIEDHIDEKWEWGCQGLSDNSVVTEEFVEKHLDQSWTWGLSDCGLLQNPSISMNFVKDNASRGIHSIDAPLLLRCYSSNPSLPLKFLEDYVGGPWNWQVMGHYNLHIFRFAEKHVNKPWNYLDFSLVE